MHTNNLGINNDDLKNSKEQLVTVLANEYYLYTKTLNFHWNITGENFIAIHQLLEAHYEWLKETIDDIAERIRSLGFTTPVDYRKYKQETEINEGDENATAEHMLTALVSSHDKIINLLRQIIKKINQTDDFATADMLIKILGQHEKNRWMLHCHLHKQ